MNEILERITNKKNLLDSLHPLPHELEKNLYVWFRNALTYNSNALEGNTLTSSQTAQIIEKQLTVGGKTIIEHLEAINHALAVDYINEFELNSQQITVQKILSIHKIILQKINDEWAGRIRQMPIRIPGSQVSRPNYVKVPELMDELIKYNKDSSDHIAKIAADSHLKLVFIHPFVDGNGRTARLLMNLILLQDNYPLVFLKAEDREKYINAIEKALLKDDLTDYYNLIFKAIEFSLDEYITAAKESK